MAEPSKHITYSFEDIQRYVQGKMSATEMHDIEKSALQDPFLADAIEGFNEADLSTAKQHINEINAALFTEKKESKVVGFNKKTRWFNIAALVIVLAGIGIVISYILRSSSTQSRQTEIAKVQQEPLKNKSANDTVSTPANSNALTTKPDTNSFIAENKTAKKTQSLQAKRKEEEKVAMADDNTLNKAKAGTYNADVVAAAAAPAAEKTMMSRSYNAANPSLKNNDSVQVALQGKVSGLTVLPATFSGRVIDENSNPIAGVSIVSADKKDAVLTDINGNFNLLKTDTLLNVTASTVGYNSKNTTLKQGLNKPIVLNPNNTALNEVVVTGYGTQRKKSDFSTDSIVREQTKIAEDAAMPVGGWKNFNNYVVTQLNKDTTRTSVTNTSDLVELEFLIDKTGNPYDITVTRSPDEKQSTKAIDLLKNGPKWTKPSKKKKTKLVINF